MTTRITYPLRHPAVAAIPLALGVLVSILAGWDYGAVASVSGLIGWGAAWLDAGPDPQDGEPMR